MGISVERPSPRYCASRLAYRRRHTLEVAVGDVVVGGTRPIRVQSMTTPETADVVATTEQIVRLARAGCEIVRVTVPTRQDADALPAIRAELARQGVRVPLVADIHFSPQAAMRAVEHVEKIRVNPGNYADRKRFEVREYTDAEYGAELERVRERFVPLVDRARELGVAMRVGTNHGSLSDRIVNRHGDTPEGMVESALEFVRIAEDRDYRQIILSMKASNPQVMIRAYRLLAARLEERGTPYPFHVGVTEAGAGEDGRIKSAVGIGGLLDDGIGETVRVSLTEDPVAEVPVAFRLVERYNRGLRDPFVEEAGLDLPDPYEFRRRAVPDASWGRLAVGGDAPPRVEVEIPDAETLGDGLHELVRSVSAGDASAEVVRVPVSSAEGARRLTAARARPGSTPLPAASRDDGAPPALAALPAPALLDDEEILGALAVAADRLDLVVTADTDPERLRPALTAAGRAGGSVLLEGRLEDDETRPALVERLVILAELAVEAGAGPALSLRVTGGARTVPAYRHLAGRLAASSAGVPLVLRDDAREGDDPLLDPPRRLGSLLVDGLGDAVLIHGAGDEATCVRRAYDILQASRRRTSRVEYISCPSCGRTLFDLEDVTREVQRVTGHLKDLKIAVMGCIVNGPGEMADADFGYVGWGPGRVALFVGKDCVEKDIPSPEAPARLVDLIRRHGRWHEPAAGS